MSGYATSEPGTLNLEPLSLELVDKCIKPKHYCQDIIGNDGQGEAKKNNSLPSLCLCAK